MDDFADLARRDVFHVIRHDARLDIERGLAGRSRLAQLVFRLQHRGERRDLSLAIEIPQPHLRQAALHREQHFDRHDRGAVISFAQTRKIRAIERRRAQHGDPDGRRREERSDAMRGDPRKDQIGGGLADDEVGRAEIDGRAEERVELGAMIERHRVQREIFGLHVSATVLSPVEGLCGIVRS